MSLKKVILYFPYIYISICHNTPIISPLYHHDIKNRIFHIKPLLNTTVLPPGAPGASALRLGAAGLGGSGGSGGQGEAGDDGWSCVSWWMFTIWLFNIAMERSQFLIGKPL
jgi:hypothetical protein